MSESKEKQPNQASQEDSTKQASPPQPQSQQPNTISNVNNIPQMPIDPNHPPHGPPMMVINRLTPIHPQPFIIPHHPSHPYRPPHETTQTNGQSHGRPMHPPRNGPPPQLFNPQYASGITHIPVTHIPVPRPPGLPANMVLTPIHPAPPPNNVTFTAFNPGSFNVPPVQTIYSTSSTPPCPPSAQTPPHPPPSNGNTLHTLSNIRQRELLPINPNNHLYANSQQIAQSNPNQPVPAHVRSTLNQMHRNDHQSQIIHSDTNRSNTNNKNHSNATMPQIPSLQTINAPKATPFAYSEFQGQMKRIQTWNKKKMKQEERLKQM
eukprot:243757_1